jgi:wyosine [tRNA(Phe)-imidazoG37] synthetase (radical SAM superfamily)
LKSLNTAKSPIAIVNWLLTRKCNLECDYCAIVKNYPDMPKSYPFVGHYYQNEMSTEVVLKALEKFHKYNPNTFHIFYGGEPLLRKDLATIISFCNNLEIPYTIISNNSEAVQPLIEKLFEEVGFVEGFTSSVDPIVYTQEDYVDPSRLHKSTEGLSRLKHMKKWANVRDVVAEITISQGMENYLIPLIKDLSENQIYSDITFVDIAKNDFYDFSNVRDEEFLVKPTLKLAKIFLELLESDYLIHMKDLLLPEMFDTLPSNFDCDLENRVHNVTVDADGSMRLCLRIKGEVTPTIHVSNLFDSSGAVSKDFYDLMCVDKRRHCELCNHSCLMMSKHISKRPSKKDIIDSLFHRED